MKKLLLTTIVLLLDICTASALGQTLIFGADSDDEEDALQTVTDVILMGDHNMLECNVGDDLTAYLNSLLIVLPEDAADKAVKWSNVSGGDAVAITDEGSIKAVKRGMAILQAAAVDNPNAKATVTIKVHNPAMDIHFAKDTITVEYGTEAVDIGQILAENISFYPSDFESLDGVTITSDRPDDVVAIDELTVDSLKLRVKARAVGSGRAVITVGIDYRDYLKEYTSETDTVDSLEFRVYSLRVTKSFMVDVIGKEVPVEGLLNTSTREFEECNVGDDLTAHLNRIVQALPEGATNKAVEWTVLRDGDAVDVTDGGTVKAVKPGMAILQATAADNRNVTAMVTVLVHNPAADIRFGSDTLYAKYFKETFDISQKLIDNISFLPSDYESLEGITVTSDRPDDVVSIEEVAFDMDTQELSLKARVLGAGIAVVTVGIEYRDYLKEYTSATDTVCRTRVTRSFTMDVIQGIIPVSSIENTSSRELEECNVGDDLTSYLNSLITVLPEDAYDKSVIWTTDGATDYAEEGEVSIGDDCVIKAVRSGKVRLVATSNDNRNATAYVTVLVHNPATDIQLTNTTINYEYNGSPSDVGQKIQENISFLPSDFESIDGLTVISDRQDDVVAIDDFVCNMDTHSLELTARAIGSGEATITVSFDYRNYLLDYTSPAAMEHRTKVSKSFIVAVTIPTVSSLTYPDDLVLSRRHNVHVHLSKEPEYGILDPSLVEIRIEESKNEGWGEAAIAIPSTSSATEWNMRGKYIGSYRYQVYYNGQPQLTNSGATEGVIHIPAEYLVAQGWDWISLYATGQTGSLPIDRAWDWIQEIRSQHELLYNDPESGFFGDLEQLTATNGMYKVNSHYDETDAGQMVLSAGYDGLISSSTIRLPEVHRGFTWITYPHELDHSLGVLSSYLSQSASEGDMIIGRDMFAVFNDSKWRGTDDCVFEAGKGYIYFTESSTPKTINWGPSALMPEGQGVMESRGQGVRIHGADSPWTYNPYAYPDCMAVIASIDGIIDSENYLVGAFVGNECRGLGEAGDDGIACIAITGQTGDIVTFRLYNKQTGSYVMTNGSFGFDGHMGSIDNPLRLYADGTALGTVHDRAVMVKVYDLQGRCMATGRGTTDCTESLPKGIYIVCISDGSKQMKKKIKK